MLESEIYQAQGVLVEASDSKPACWEMILPFARMCWPACRQAGSIPVPGTGEKEKRKESGCAAYPLSLSLSLSLSVPVPVSVPVSVPFKTYHLLNQTQGVLVEVSDSKPACRWMVLPFGRMCWPACRQAGSIPVPGTSEKEKQKESGCAAYPVSLSLSVPVPVSLSISPYTSNTNQDLLPPFLMLSQHF